jgi:DNA-binding NarL/FixJ family response regulator
MRERFACSLRLDSMLEAEDRLRQGAAIITVFILSDLRLYREGLADLLDRDEHTDVIGTGSDALASIERVRELRPRVVLVDMTIRDCFAAVRVIRAADSAPDVVGLAIPGTESEIVQCAEAGLSGYVARGASLQELVATLDGVGRGELACSPRTTSALFRRVGTLAAERAPGAEANMPLTPREVEIMTLIEEGLSNKQIAQRLFIEVATVKNHLHNIFEKLRVHRRGDAIARLRNTRNADLGLRPGHFASPQQLPVHRT